ncbi:primosomal protein N' (replication factor Y) - superfamily II helicase [Aliigemmobacter aestuarii]|uniref:Primosomal protein N' (Replication factor Y)-superfamily II helicase n=1 Tax=Aliigemmobacter aestuarii TaxID=1445661 RepID=A0A4S3MJZ0_9RHOB|nr:TFIIB-type zinc finger domain-containing protein [Gemmobacter aestuarii]THD81608.1 primosomal protein N' (replication factor Y) - superfamily II helicase [Gemmobacter aestuarii]
MAEEHRYPCEQCGADLRFQPGASQLVCDHCGHVQAIPEAGRRQVERALGELDLARALKDDLPPDAMEEVRSTTCPSCGAVVEFSGASHATECPFCATPVVVDTGTHRHIKPQALIPFALDEREARSAMTKWLGSLWFAPNGLLEYARKGRAMTGVYVPHWTFDADTATRYRGQRGDAYYESRTVTVTVNGKAERRTEQVRKIRWTPVTGKVSRRFDDMVVMASTSVPARLGDGLTPWDLSALVPYSPDYLSGFHAEGYTVTLARGHAEARERMGRIIAGDIRNDIGGDEQRIDGAETNWRDETFKHVLLPVWTAAYKYNGRSFRFLVNGQTGEVQGERPWSVWKILFAALVVAIFLGALAYANDPEAFHDAFGLSGNELPEWLTD